MPREVITPLIVQHADDAAFLWLQRDEACRAPHYSRANLAGLDARLAALLDALRLDGELGWRIARKALDLNEPGELFVAAVLAVDHHDLERLAEVANVAAADPVLSRALRSALGWMPSAVVAERLRPWWTSPVPVQRLAAVAAAALHRRDPGAPVQRALEDADPVVRARALRAVGELGLTLNVPLLRRSAQHPDAACRFWACWSAVRLGDRAGVAELQLLAQSEQVAPRLRERAVALIGRLLEPAAALRWLAGFAHLPGGPRLGVTGLGTLGDPAGVPRLLDAMATPELARLAGESFTFITGAELADHELEGTPPDGFEAGPTEDAGEENVELDPDEHLPWPDVDRVRQWWKTNRERFRPGVRHLLGRPITIDGLREVLRGGRQRQRIAAALELAVREPGKPMFEWRAPGFRQ